MLQPVNTLTATQTYDRLFDAARSRLATAGETQAASAFSLTQVANNSPAVRDAIHLQSQIAAPAPTAAPAADTATTTAADAAATATTAATAATTATAAAADTDDDDVNVQELVTQLFVDTLLNDLFLDTNTSSLQTLEDQTLNTDALAALLSPFPELSTTTPDLIVATEAALARMQTLAAFNDQFFADTTGILLSTLA